MSSAAKVGIFMLVILAILGYFILKIQRISVGGGPTKKVTAIFDSVAGLDKKSKVRIAGVEVGDVTNIRLRPDGKAEVTMEIDRSVELHRGAFARVVNMGLLGEKYVELVPGAVNEPAMPEQQALQGQVPTSLDEVTGQISAIATDVKAITASLRATMAGPEGQQRMQDIVENIRQITAQVRELVAANRTNIDATLGNAREITAELRTEIPKLAQSIDQVANTLSGTVGENRQDLHEVVDNLRKLSGDMRTTVDNLNAITGQVRSGEGTVGKLLYSEEAHQRLTSALSAVESGVNELRTTLGRANRISLDLGMKAEYQAGGETNQGEVGNPVGGHTRAAVMARIIPNPERNRFYNIELADDPRGKRVDKSDQFTLTDPNTGQSQTVVVDETRFERGFRVSAQAGWNLQPLSLRIGLFDSTGGAGLDYQYNNRLRFTGEMYDFSRRYDPNPHLRLYGEYIFRHEKPNTPQLFLTSGVDNVFNKTAFTFGGGIRWRDDDLKYLLGSVPLPR
ncbi:MAG TPA: MlaD family protein [Thermoanaerobaculia bacterium]|nr:MlaD family protein [Thermoanaerobaculia bacterium]